VVQECGPSFAQATASGTIGLLNVPPYPLPAKQVMPKQEPGAPRRPSGACPGRDELVITITGAPRRVGKRSVRVHVRIVHSSPLRSVAVRLNGRQIRHGRAARLTITVRDRALRKGHNRLTVIAVDATGKRASRSVSFEHLA
jgi:hypothetical protein